MLISLLLACGSGDGPPEIHYDTDPCDLCGMVISDPASAAALVTDAGATFTFDDPGCLISYRATHPDPNSRAWFSDGARWYPQAEVAFLVGAETPMGSGLHAVPAGTAGAITLEEARARLLGP